jgi:hypothetical protein
MLNLPYDAGHLGFLIHKKTKTTMIFKVKGEGHRVKFLPHNILVNTLESISFNGFFD